MIGIDTSILLRLWLNDDPARNKRIDALLAAHGGMAGMPDGIAISLHASIETCASCRGQGTLA